MNEGGHLAGFIAFQGKEKDDGDVEIGKMGQIFSEDLIGGRVDHPEHDTGAQIGKMFQRIGLQGRW